MKKNLVWLAVILSITTVLVYFFLRSVEWKEVFANLSDVDLKYFILFVLLAPLHLLTRAWRWQFLLKQEKTKTSLYNRFAANAIGFTVTDLIPGRIGELIRPLFLAQKEEMKKGFVISTVIIERIFDVFTMCLLLALFLLAKPFYVSVFDLDKEIQNRLFFLGILGFAIVFFLLAASFSLYFFKKKTLSVLSFFLKQLPEKISSKVLQLIDEFINGLKFFHSFRDVGVYLLLSLFVWLAMIFMYWILFFAFHIEVPFFFLIPYVFFLAVGAAIPTPGMVGGFHFFSKLGLTSLYGVEPNPAVGMTIVNHAVQIIVTCLIGFIILWKEGLSLLQIKKMGRDD
jgi:uncharacterized protein (TIRG00374 family)